MERFEGINWEKYMGMGSKFLGTFIVVALLFIFMPVGIITVQPNEVAVEVDKLGHRVNPDPQGVGYHIYNRWITDMVIYKVSSRAFPQDSMATDAHANEWNMNLKTNDGQNVQVDMTIIYSLNSNQVPKLHETVGPTYEEQILLPQVRSESRIAIGQYSAEDIYNGKIRDQIQIQIKKRLMDSVSKYPAINIQDALMRDFRFSPEFEHAIESKKLASQAVEVNKNKALAQEQEALRVEAEARGNKLKAIQEAEGQAQSIKINADAQRYRLEQEAAGDLARYKAEAEGKRLAAEALGGGQNVVALEFAKNIPNKLQIWGIPVGANNTSLMDMSGVFGSMFKGQKKE